MEIVIKPLDNESNIVCLNVNDELRDILNDTNYGPRVISDKNLSTLVRHMAMHVNVSKWIGSINWGNLSRCCDFP